MVYYTNMTVQRQTTGLEFIYFQLSNYLTAKQALKLGHFWPVRIGGCLWRVQPENNILLRAWYCAFSQDRKFEIRNA